MEPKLGVASTRCDTQGPVALYLPCRAGGPTQLSQSPPSQMSIMEAQGIRDDASNRSLSTITD